MAVEIIRKRFSFSGTVQGVGFRWRARHAAESYGATGWVRNERDGSVTMELQGSEETIERVLDAVERGAYIHIDGMDVKTLSVETEERGFSTRGDW
ncbi:MAG: acylphosphatase [Oscillospiraceae bacterium]|nr:acylphosphatase [Oscillospiraceae bacterium]